MGLAGVTYLAGLDAITQAFEHLGYPHYVQNILGPAKLIGAMVLLLPGRPFLREWAYAGFAFTFAGAAASHLAVGDRAEVVAPLAAAGVLAVSYVTRPAIRRRPTGTDGL